MMYRFDTLAIWHRRILSKDGEQARSGVKGVPFWCFEKVASKGSARHIQGAESPTTSVVLQTANEIAIDIEAGDEIEYKGHGYTVLSVEEIRSMAGRRAKEYVIALE